jgi:hypothetical protein
MRERGEYGSGWADFAVMGRRLIGGHSTFASVEVVFVGSARTKRSRRQLFCSVLCPAEWCHCVAVSHSQILKCQSVLGLIEDVVRESN